MEIHIKIFVMRIKHPFLKWFIKRKVTGALIHKSHTKNKPRACVCAKSLQLCLTLPDAIDCSPPGFSLHGILQARILEWIATPSSRGSS